MANRRRGEVSAMLDGREHTLCLTLGALAELEATLGASDLAALAARFETGRPSAADLLAVARAGLKGGGHDYTREEVGQLTIEGGAPAWLALVVDLLRLTFGVADDPPPVARADAPAGPPSPGTTCSPSGLAS
jgi:hypothetical protein